MYCVHHLNTFLLNFLLCVKLMSITFRAFAKLLYIFRLSMPKQRSRPNWNDRAWWFTFPHNGLDYINDVDYQIRKVDLDLDDNDNIIVKKCHVVYLPDETKSFSCQLSIPKQVKEIKFYVNITLDDESKQQRLLCTVTYYNCLRIK